MYASTGQRRPFQPTFHTAVINSLVLKKKRKKKKEVCSFLVQLQQAGAGTYACLKVEEGIKASQETTHKESQSPPQSVE